MQFGRTSWTFGIERGALAARLLGLAGAPAAPPVDSPAQRAADRALVAAVVGGSGVATDAFVARMICIPRIVVHLNQAVGRLHPETLEDVVQEVFRRVWANLGAYRGEGSLESWVYGFALRTLREFARDETRARLRTSDSPLDEEALWRGGVFTRRDTSAADRLIAHEALAQLPPDVRPLVLGRVIEDLSFQELAKRLGETASVLKRRYYRALAALRNAASDAEGER